MRALPCIALLWVAGCAPSAELILEIHSDYEPGVEFDAVELSVDGDARSERAVALGYSDGGVRLVPRSVAHGLHEIRVSLRLGGRPVASRRLTRMIAQTTVLPVWLIRLCENVRCDAPLECDGGRCVDPGCVAGESCATGGCDVDTDCAPSEVSCRVARCDRGACLLVPVAGACDPADYCHPMLGCVPRAADGDAGAADAGEADAPSPCGSCDDGNPCTDDVCAGASCTHPHNTASCSDGDACTRDDRCAGGSCAGTAYGCTPPPCGSASCDGSGGCSVSGGCGGGSVCDGSSCVPCGGADQRCCDSGACGGGLWCYAGVCTCGQAGGPCCPWDGSCAVAGTCNGGTCRACFDYGTPCNGLLPCCAGVCRSGICID